MKIPLDFTIPPEPADLKEYLKNKLPYERRFGMPIISQGSWIAHDLWTLYGWKYLLRPKGVMWHDFMKAVNMNYRNFISWINDELSWNDAVFKILEILDIKVQNH